MASSAIAHETRFMNTSTQSEILRACHRYTNSFTTTGENVYYPTLTKDSQHESKQFKSNTLKQENLAFARFFNHLNLVAHDFHLQTPLICKYYPQRRLLMKVSKVHFGVYLHDECECIIIERRKSRGCFPLFSLFFEGENFQVR